jgi:glucose-1-phosphate adenylyltransferase
VYDFSNNRIPGETREQSLYWRDVGTLESYYDSNMTLRNVVPEINLYNDHWPIRTAPGQSAPAKFIFSGEGGEKRRGEAIDSIVSGGCIISGGRVKGSVLSRGVKVHGHAMVENCILFPDVDVGRGARVRNAIVDRAVHVDPDDEIGYNIEADRKRFFVSDSGIVVVSPPQRKPVY